MAHISSSQKCYEKSKVVTYAPYEESAGAPYSAGL